MSEVVESPTLSPEGQATLAVALYGQAQVHFELASELTIAASAIKRESVNGHHYIEPRLSPQQVQQRQAILGIAYAVVDAARLRALESFHTLMESSKTNGRDPELLNGTET